MTPERQISTKHVELPETVWERIASVMPLKDWARASGTCRNTARVQLETVNIVTRDITRAGKPLKVFRAFHRLCDLAGHTPQVVDASCDYSVLPVSPCFLI